MRNLLLFFCFTVALSATAQSTYILSAKDSYMVIKGTSTLHEWQCKVEQTSGQMVAEADAGTIKSIKSLVLNAIVSSIKSIDEKGAYYEKGMDKNVYRALKSDKFPNITFTLQRIQKSSVAGKNTVWEGAGVLKMAGAQREIVVKAKSSVVNGGVLFEGSVPLKMTDYNVEPPTAIFGTIQTGNEVKLDFKMFYLLSPSH
jgi:polyisoprenoid-binding protein YceI